ncbi:helix-turn-helix transcriptional regulator [Aerococcus urinae]|uniref:Helix-turn-helix transcriptional regulator n=1 Tax=Aerococcus urinae TaxID=1376 RepID=A0A109RE38_9LACT|nr:helix-turn-helix transcriptional regulator [Aerococcus urinae]AMB95035.1 transcriptional repressor CcpN [Aerococcus urinae]MCY3031743.1 helix-turn-helix transcriptional regulator [Aerococcus urinae]MCY3037262.1 helix-turn-helix transcriptional regulator [Aerococcus urinae]MCY3043790.1 helix-turn-helix transcriptional regulator [Aerococcus urinae]MCY3046565.1 helix-turn-helix transcriptional regulator [Aerococcus urinae]
MQFTDRQKQIIAIVKDQEPISGEAIAKQFGLSKSTLRSDLALLTMTGILDARPKVGYFYTGLGFDPLLGQKLSEVKVAELMASPVNISAKTTVYEAITTMFLYDNGSLYVTDEDQHLQGLVSRKDLLRSLATKSQTESPAVALIMTRMPNIVVVEKDTLVLEAGKLLVDHKVDSLPVVNNRKDYQVLGKITKSHLVEFFVNTLANEGDL